MINVHALAYRAGVTVQIADGWLHGVPRPLSETQTLALEKAHFEMSAAKGRFQSAVEQLEAILSDEDASDVEKSHARKALQRMKPSAAKPAVNKKTDTRAAKPAGPPETRNAAHSAPSLVALSLADQQALQAGLVQLEANITKKLSLAMRRSAPQKAPIAMTTNHLQMQLSKFSFGTEKEREAARAQLESTADGKEALAHTSKMLGAEPGKRGIWFEGNTMRISARPALKHEGR
ncbi:MAG: hypothetical protein QM756_12370 [Polyangiaceae bacterium]